MRYYLGLGRVEYLALRQRVEQFSPAAQHELMSSRCLRGRWQLSLTRSVAMEFRVRLLDLRLLRGVDLIDVALVRGRASSPRVA